MDKMKMTFSSTSMARLFVLATCMFSFSSPVEADTRSEAREAVIKLRQSSNLTILPDELASIETTYSVAEQYYKQNNIGLSEQYYLLTIQKASILNPALLPKPVVISSINKSETNQVKPSNPSAAAIAAPAQQQPLKTTDSKTDAAITPKTVNVPQVPDTDISVNSNDEADETVKTDDDQDYLTTGIVSSDLLVGNPSTYTVTKSDNIRLVAAKLGVSRQHLMEMNNLNSKSVLKQGQQIKYNNRKIIPQLIKNGIVINIPEKTLYFFIDGKLNRSIPVALGVATKTKKFDWKTPTGKFKIVSKQKNPTWYVPSSIQEEMEDNGKEVITSIPPGPSNPLGKYAFKTSLPGILIHSTIRPASIYSFASHGCIRVYPQHMEEFFNAVKVNTPGEIIYRPVKLANTESGRIFLEVHNDVYGKSPELNRVAKQLIEKQNLSDRVNWNKVKNVVKQKAGIAEDITL